MSALDKRIERLERRANERQPDLLPFADMSDAELTSFIEQELAKMTPAEQAKFWAEWEAEHGPIDATA